MDSITQMALGGAVGYAVAGNKVGKKAIVWGAAFGTLPDLDVLIPFDNAVAAFTYHRGFSHSLLMHLLVSPLLVWLIVKIHGNTAEYKMRWFWLVFLCLTTHAVLDSFTVYGTQLLWPITDFPFTFSNLFIIDPAVTLPLLIGLCIAALPKVTTKSAIRANSAALSLVGVYIGWSMFAKYVIDNKVDDALANRGIKAQAVISTPAPFTTLLWRVVVMTEQQYYEGYASIFDEPDQVSLDAYPTQPELIDAVKDQWGISRLQWFTKGFYSVRLRGSNIVLSDLRMGVECGYVFNFEVAQQSANGIEVGTYNQFSERPDLDNLPKIFQRITDSTISLAPDVDERGVCK